MIVATKTMLRKKCKSLDIELTGNETKREIARLLNNHFKMELFYEEICNRSVQIKITRKGMNIVNKAEFRNKQKPNNDMVKCIICQKEYEKKKFRTITGRVLNICVYCRRAREY